MKDWPAPAREELERALDAHHARLVGTGVDADEVVADLRRHVETEVGSGGAPAVEEVRAVLKRLVESEGGDSSEPRQTPVGVPPVPERSKRLRRGVLHWTFLVILPAVTLVFELATGMCATELFDPIGRWPQLLAVAAVPVIFAAILLGQHLPGWGGHLRWVRAAAAFACGVCAYYAFQFVILTPFAFIGIIAYGLGLLPLAPLLALVVSLDLLQQLRRLGESDSPTKAGRVWPLVFVAVGGLVLTDLGGICASLGLRWYASEDPAVRARGLALLRSRFVDPGDIDHPWRVNGPGSGTDAVLGLVSGQNGRIFGAEFDRVQFAATGSARDLADPDLRRRTRSRGRAGAARWNMLGDLTLDGSRLDGTIDPDLLYGYVEWTMTLHNGENWPLEGRATLQLPPGGVVSRVTLWIDGEEREAAFAGRSVATKAYESVAIVQRRDPILVTTAGPDRVRLRCFPVPADGQMKFRLGITFPLQPSADGASAAVLAPSILESNFAVPSVLRHHLWIGRAVGEAGRVDDPDTEKLRGPVANDALGREPVVVRRDAGRTTVMSRAFDGSAVVEQGVRATTGAPRRLALVIDGNPRVLREHGQLVLDGLQGGGGAGLDLWLALDRPIRRSFDTIAQARAFLAGVVESGEVSDGDGGEIAVPHRGGFDNGEALASALAAAHGSDGTVVWLHGPQVVPAGAGDAVRQAIERSGRKVELVELAIIPGRNDILEALDGRPEVRHVGGGSAGILRDVISRAVGEAGLEIVRSRRTIADSASGGQDLVATRHIARLWAAGEVMRLSASGPARQADAVALAVEHQLVTPVSGAVVLETQAQYDAHGLKPVEPATVPTVPEVGSFAVVLLAVVAVMAAGWAVRRRAMRA